LIFHVYWEGSLTDTQSLASKQGRTFKELAKQMLEARGGQVLKTNFHPEDDAAWPKVDLKAIDRNGSVWWLHARGSWRGSRPGLQRSDTVRKLLAVVYDLHPLATQQGIFQGVITSHLPESGTGHTMLDRAVKRRVVWGVFLVDLSLDELKEVTG
jgi:hypothetical protein